MAKKAKESVNKEINKFGNWISSHVPEKIKVPVNKKVNSLKEEVNKIFNRIDKFTPKEHKSALKGYLKTYRIDGQKGFDPKNFLINIKLKVIKYLIQKQKKPVKVKFILTCRFIKENPATREIVENFGYFHSEVETITESTDLSEIFNTMTERLIELIDQYTNSGSGWQFDHIESFDININPFEPISGSSYISLPQKLANKKAIINVKNENDHECFKWAVTSAVYRKEKDPQRLNKEMRENSEKFDWSGIEFPVNLKDIDKFEKQNNYAVNVFGYEDSVYPLRISKKQVQESNIIDMLLISNEETNHYCWIKDLSKLLSKQISNHNGKRYFCHICLNSFRSDNSLQKLIEYCQNHDAVKVEMSSEEDKILKFEKLQ